MLTLIYSLLLLISCFRLKKSFNFTPSLKNSFVFYIVVTLVIISKIICCSVAAALGTALTDKQALAMLYFPGLLFILSFFLLVWQMLKIYPQAHLKPEAEELLLTMIGKLNANSRFSKANGFIVFFLTVLIGMQTTLFFAYAANKLSKKVLFRELLVMNLLISTFILSLTILIQVKYSSLLTCSEIWKKRTRKVTFVTYYWAAMMLIKYVIIMSLGSFLYETSQIVSNNSSQDSLFILSWFFIIEIFSEVVSIWMVFETNFIEIFIYSQEEDAEEIILVPVERRRTTVKPGNRNMRFTMIAENPLKKPEDINIIEGFEPVPNKLGKTYRALFKDSLVFYRKISFNRLSSYVIEEFLAEIDSYKEILTENIIPTIGIIINEPIVGLISPYFPTGSLFKLLHISKTPLKFKQKIEVAIRISEIFEEIHSIPRAHGHLTSHNILMNSDMQPNISDLGFFKLKKYAGLMLDYTNISAWSSPEIILEKRLTPQKARPSDDSYSFGVVLWEIFSEKIPFEGSSKEDLYKLIVTNSYRPSLENIPSPVAELIHSCWNPNPGMRPLFVDITESLQELIN